MFYLYETDLFDATISLAALEAILAKANCKYF